MPIVVDGPRQPPSSCVLNAPPSTLYNGKTQVSPPDKQAQAAEELQVVTTVIFFNSGFNSGVVNKAQCEEKTVAPLECFDFKFSGAEGDEKRSQIFVFHTLRAVARESCGGQRLDNIEFRTAVFVGSKLMPSATYHSTILSKEKKGN